METLERILVEHPFFEGWAPQYVELLVGCASNVRFPAGEYVFREGQEADRFYLLRHGKVALQIDTPQRGPITIQTLAPGDVLGWSWLIPPYYWRFEAKAVEPVHALALDGKCLRAKCEDDHDLGYELLKRFSHLIEVRLQATRLQLLEIHNALYDLVEGRT